MIQDNTLKILNIVPGTVVDGLGLRTSIYMAGCGHHCIGCHNPQSWDHNTGVEMSVPEIVQKCLDEKLPVTLTGGDPLFNTHKCLLLCKALNNVGILDIWLYTGYQFEQINYLPLGKEILSYLQYIVDGPFIEQLKDLSLKFRGSTNQRIYKHVNNLWIDVTADFN